MVNSILFTSRLVQYDPSSVLLTKNIINVYIHSADNQKCPAHQDVLIIKMHALILMATLIGNLTKVCGLHIGVHIFKCPH